MATTPLHLLTASEAFPRLPEGTLTVEAYAQELLERIHSRDDAIKAWACIDPDLVLEQARVLDKIPMQERGLLHGLPVGIKDIIYTKGWFGRSVADLAVLADVFGLKDDEPSTFNGIRGAKFAICRTDNWPFVGEGTKKALDKAVALLGDHGATVDQLSLPYSVLKNVDQKCAAFPTSPEK